MYHNLYTAAIMIIFIVAWCVYHNDPTNKL